MEYAGIKNGDSAKVTFDTRYSIQYDETQLFAKNNFNEASLFANIITLMNYYYYYF